MMRFLLRAALMVLATLLLLVVAAMLLLPTSVGSSFIENQLRSRVHPQLQINGTVSFSVLPRLGLALTDVTVASDKGASPTVSVKRAEADLRWWPLLSNQVVVDTIYLQGIEVHRQQASWQPLLDEFNRFEWVRDGRWWQSLSGASTQAATWQVVIKQALIEDISVSVEGQLPQSMPALTLEQAVFMADGQWPEVVGATAKFGLRQLSVNDLSEFGHVPALLEQLGVTQDSSLDLMMLDSQWRLAADRVDLDSLQASGPWGQMSASAGWIDASSGELSIPIDATLTNAPSLQTRGLQINVRRSQLQFLLTGTLSQPGVQWLTRRPSKS